MTLTGEPFLYNLMLSQFCKCDSRTRFRSDSDDKDDDTRDNDDGSEKNERVSLQVRVR